MPNRILGKGNAALEVSALGLGCMGMSANHGIPPQEKDMIKLLHEAYELGVRYFDTAEIYGPHTNEILLGKAFRDRRDKVIIGTKFGLYYPFGKQQQDSSKKSILRAIDESLKRLNTDYVDLYTQHRVDTDVPIEEVADTMNELIKMGKIRHYGLSEAGANTIRRANKVCAITSIQSHYSMMMREVEDNDVLKTCEELGIGFTAYSPLERGFLGGLMNENTTFHPTLDMRSSFPRFTPEALKANQSFINYVRELAKNKKIDGKEATTAQIALAWLLAQKPFIMPIPETTKIAHLKQNLDSLKIKFSKEELMQIDSKIKTIKIVGERYPIGSDQAKSVGL
ncbi:oxidoreductase, aldo/keto reductase family protein [Helicobacter canadensis MIT 98-5491]|nr:oxidoreductase, aldo/keto reductase family protein [Helicobacter canadensis MIT 98-5491]